jgi:epoxyqueuosine reductase
MQSMSRRRDPVPTSPAQILAAIRDKALSVGFEAFGVASLEGDWPEAERLETFIALDRHGQMDWMPSSLERRRHPRAMWPEARSALVLGLNYGPDSDPLASLTRHDEATISIYASGDDYHDVIKKRLKVIGGWMAQTLGCQLKVFVDTAPLMEKPLAARAGLGWQGKHTNLVSRQFGSWLFLGVILTDLDLPADLAEVDHCGSCRACLDICPTGAFPAPYQLDARACISYLTIEHRGPVPEIYRGAMGNRIYGCDDCLAVCPWNKFAQQAAEQAFHRRESLDRLKLLELVQLDDAGFRTLFAKSPVKRIGRDRFVRNVLYALGNSGDLSCVAVVETLRQDPDEAVADAAEWALERLKAQQLDH